MAVGISPSTSQSRISTSPRKGAAKPPNIGFFPTVTLRCFSPLHENLGAFLAMQALEALVDDAIEGDGLDPSLLRIGARGHLGDDGGEGIAGQRDAGHAGLGP